MKRVEFLDKLEYFYPNLYNAFYIRSGADIIIFKYDRMKYSDHTIKKQNGLFDMEALYRAIGRVYNSRLIAEYSSKEYDLLFEYVCNNKHKHDYWLL
jgi:hypothetical protein